MKLIAAIAALAVMGIAGATTAIFVSSSAAAGDDFSIPVGDLDVTIT